MKIGIVGLGLMGGSLSLALQKQSEAYYFIGMDHNALHCSQALELGLVDEITDSLVLLKTCDIIILSIPVDSIIAMIKSFDSLPQTCTLIDLGSTKEKISLSVPAHIRENFVAAHPMTGTEKFGPTAALEDLYMDKVVVLCDLEKSGTHQQEVAKKLFTDIGMQLVCMGSKEHDRHAAFISHMPHAVSFSLANSVITQEGSKSIVALAGGGFKDMSRIAKSSPNMWEDIFRQNKTNVLEALAAFEVELDRCREMVQNEEWERLNAWMQKANSLHDILS
ncbi:MAG: prephenate dehydrogenase [Sulfurovum sp. 39-42-12]|nr:MAG: prephenate dehydrogenase [Sulfurovum sp. 35-42-20]OYZ26906.1 MAG: prephenate dehydrogenase [Sulfurovum sp. 16-42-52]OYZ50593.1 MAG: prephenate dehydrogenase [Sulfurovum sp. 24-42-9]OZA46734.1 MAG: prephenate dehydrogenase [Sulfurovum sp. 17-42-90]OZA60514.1 MAG: prephenate dehydrogenase [Sulfurovum sp. 39-42-12]